MGALVRRQKSHRNVFSLERCDSRVVEMDEITVFSPLAELKKDAGNKRSWIRYTTATSPAPLVLFNAKTFSLRALIMPEGKYVEKQNQIPAASLTRVVRFRDGSA